MPCGRAGDAESQCDCLPDAISRYRARVSGPLLDRIDMRVGVPRIPFAQIRDRAPRETSATVRERVIRARERMRERLGKGARRCNAEMTKREVERSCQLDPRTEGLLATAVASSRMSARGYHRVLRVARTVADLAAQEAIMFEHVALALLLRGQT